MNTLKLKEQINLYVSEANEDLLLKINDLVVNYKANSNIASHDAKGQPYNFINYQTELKSALLEIENGHFITQEDLEEEAKKW